jgi:hypothetical protein
VASKNYFLLKEDVKRLSETSTGLVKILVACFVEGCFETNINQRLLRLCVFVENNECFGL